MKAILHKMASQFKWFTLVFFLSFFLPGCTTYKRGAISEEVALSSTSPMGIQIGTKKYRVESLYRMHDTLYAYVTNRSKLARNYPEYVVKRTNNGSSMNLGRLPIEAIYQVDQALSVLGSIFVGVSALGLAFLASAGLFLLLWVAAA